MSDISESDVPAETLFLPQEEEIRRWHREPGGRGLLVTAPSGGGKTTLLDGALGAYGVIRLECFPPRGAAEVVGELALAFLARGENRLHETVSGTPPFNVQLEIAKETLVSGGITVWFDDIDFLGRGSLADYASQGRERSELMRILAVAAHRGARLVVTTRRREGESVNAALDGFLTVELPSLSVRSVSVLWERYGGEGKAPANFNSPLAVRLAGKLAREGEKLTEEETDLPLLFPKVWKRLSGGAKTMALFCCELEGAVTRGVLGFLERKGECPAGAPEELVAWGILVPGGENRFLFNPAFPPLIAREAGEETPERFRVREILAGFWREKGRRARSTWDLLRAACLYSRCGRTDSESEVGRRLVEELLRRGYLDLAEDLLARSIESPDVRVRAVALGNLAMVKKNQGDLAEALRLYGEAREEFEKLDDGPNVARVLHQIGNIHYLRGDLESAARHYEEGRRAAEACGDESVGAATRIQMANVLFLLGDLPGALSNYRASLETAERIGDRRMALAVLLQLGQIHYTREELLEADESLLRAGELADGLGELQSKAKALQFRGLVAKARGDVEDAVRLFREFEELGHLLDDPLLEGSASFHLGSTKLDQGDLVSALRYLARSVEIFTANDLSEVRAPWSVIGQIASQAGKDVFSKLAAQAGVEWLLSGRKVGGRETDSEDLRTPRDENGAPDQP